ncbi:hypothetical protein [Streptosporangium sp. NPDC023615]|uniref:hypothetical protein n=1 Tax=Streptosporangium sp. NPDC023615 TaxID=3154794 RepID=UPI003432DE35
MAGEPAGIDHGGQAEKDQRRREPVRSDVDEVSARQKSTGLLTGGEDKASSGPGGTENAAPLPRAALARTPSPETATAVHAKPAKGEPPTMDPRRRVVIKKLPSDSMEEDSAIVMFVIIVGACLAAAIFGIARHTLDAYGSTVDLTLSSVTGGHRPKDVKHRGGVFGALGYRLSGDAPVVSDFTLPATGDLDADGGDPGNVRRFLSSRIIFTPDRPCPDEASLTWAWTESGTSPSDEPSHTMRIDQVAVLTDVPIVGDTPRFSASISSPAPCAGSLKLVGSTIRNSNFHPHERSMFFKNIEIRERDPRLD